MMTLSVVIATEFLKLRRSRVPALSLLAYSIGPVAGGLFMWIVQEPARAGELGLIGTKAQFAGLTATWAHYLTLLVQTVGIGGMLLLSVVTAYVFGREYAEGTAKNMLAMPVARHWFVVAKLIVVFAWMAGVTVTVLIGALVIGLFLGLPDFSVNVLVRGSADVLLVSGLAFLLTPPIAWLSTLGRGYLLPLGFAILMLVIGNVFGATGWGKWFPWSIVPLFAGVAGPRTEMLAPGSVAVVIATAVAGTAAAIAHLTFSDQP